MKDPIGDMINKQEFPIQCVTEQAKMYAANRLLTGTQVSVKNVKGYLSKYKTIDSVNDSMRAYDGKHSNHTINVTQYSKFYNI